MKICENVDTCCLSGHEHKCLISTATRPTQPGACYIKWETPPKHLQSESDAPVVTTYERYADAIVYSKASFQNKVVIEIKDESGTDNTAEAHTMSKWLAFGDVTNKQCLAWHSILIQFNQRSYCDYMEKIS